MSAIGARIKQMRTEMGMSQAQLADQMHNLGSAVIYAQTVTKIECGLREVKVRELANFEIVLGVTIAWLVTGEGLAESGEAEQWREGWHMGRADAIREMREALGRMS